MLELIGLITAFTVIFILRSKKVDFALTIMTAALIIGVTSGKPLRVIIDAGIYTFSDQSTWVLVVAVSLITALGYILKETGIMVNFIENLSKILPGNILLALIPALFGFLSMPGGALMSAPFIDPEASRLGLKPHHKTYYNVWFRHLLYWINPITSSTIMATTLSGFTIRQWLTAQWPLFFVMTVTGLVMSRGFVKKVNSPNIRDCNLLELLRGITPLILTVGLTLIGLPIWFSLLTGIMASIIFANLKIIDGVKMIPKGIRYEIITSVIAMLYLRYIVILTGTVNRLFDSVITAGIPILAIILTVPLMVGAISGSPALGVGISFPIILPLFGEPNLHLTSIVFIGLTCAYITSPIHLCLVLTNSYFKSDLNKVLRYLAPSCLILFIFGVLYHLLLYNI